MAVIIKTCITYLGQVFKVMLSNPFDFNIKFENNMDDFKMPYGLYGKTDLEIMMMKYKKLTNNSHGLIVRLKR